MIMYPTDAMNPETTKSGMNCTIRVSLYRPIPHHSSANSMLEKTTVNMDVASKPERNTCDKQ